MTHGLDDPGQASDLRRVPSTEPATERHGLSPGGGSFRRSILAPTVLAGIASALLVWFWPQPVRAADTQSVPGQQLFDQHCASCHQAAGQGVEGTFPPLAGNPAAADEAYVESVIRDGLSGPIEVGGVGYDGVMPAVAALTDSGEIQQVTQYVAGLAAPSADAQDGGPDEGEG